MIHFVFGSRSPVFPPRSSSIGFESFICKRLYRKIKIKIAPKKIVVIPIDASEILYSIFPPICSIFNNIRYTSLPKRMPAKIPPMILATVVITDSRKSILPRCSFPIPRILYIPSSFFRRLIKKLLI